MRKSEIIILVLIIGVALSYFVFNLLREAIIGPSVAPIYEKGIKVITPKANDLISYPLRISGYVNGDGWVAFEGQVGLVELLDSEGKILTTGILNATTEWTKFPTYFEAVLEFQPSKTENGFLVFHNENPSGLEEKNKEFHLPVEFSLVSKETITVEVYFNNNRLDPEFSCNKVFPVEREIPKTQAVAKATLEELLKGPTEKEKNQDYLTNINPGVKIQKLVIENGVANVDFDEQLEYQVGGSCRVAAIRAQITQTLKQFPTVKDIIISINGRTEDILQP